MDMVETRTERGSCRFVVQEAEGGRSAIVIQLFQESVRPLAGATLGFGLLSGITPEQAKNSADILNEQVLDLFIVLTDSHPMF
jgi:hypothetical protein